MADSFDALEERLRGYDIHAAEIRRNGRVLWHRGFHGEGRWPVYSVTKSVTALALMLTWDDGLTGPELRLADFLEEDVRRAMPDDMAQLTFERYLTMTAGKYPFRPEGDNWLRYAVSVDTDRRDRGYHYSNIPAYLVGAACENAVGRPLMEYLNERIFDPLGMPEPPYRTSPEGHFYGATGMELTVGELSDLGEIFLGQGSFRGRRLISEGAVGAAMTPAVFTGEDHYGWFLRLGEDSAALVGKWGQRCVIWPEKGVIAAWTANEPERADEIKEIFTGYVSNCF